MTLFQDTNGNTSSKRVLGVVMLCLAMLMVFSGYIYSLFFQFDMPDKIGDLINFMFVTGASLLASGVFEKKQVETNETNV